LSSRFDKQRKADEFRRSTEERQRQTATRLDELRRENSS
uniref:Mobilization protein n=1 Tax=Anisakis simplex TaxID=6269 RepID=A0A0M3JPX1_ANISI